VDGLIDHPAGKEMSFAPAKTSQVAGLGSDVRVWGQR
jgi:hypothetical protein